MILRTLLLALLLAATVARTAHSREAQEEYIILSGGPSLAEWEKFKAAPHDRWWGNFIRAARVRIEQIRKERGPGASITWLVYKRGYQRRGDRQDKSDLISNIVSVRDKYGVSLVWVDRGPEVIAYLNRGRPRNEVKIADFEYFGHSNRACFMLDYSNEIDSASKSWIHESDLRQIHRGIFARKALIKSWGCYTGESMSARWKAATGKRMIGAIGKTDYSNGHLNGWIPTINGRWGG